MLKGQCVIYQVFSTIYSCAVLHSNTAPFAHPSHSEDIGDIPEATVALMDKKLIFKIWTLSQQHQVFLLIQVMR